MPQRNGPPGSHGPSFGESWEFWARFPEKYPDYFTFNIYFLNYTSCTFSSGSASRDSFIALSQEEWTVPSANQSPPFPESAIPSLTTLTYKWIGERRTPNGMSYDMFGPDKSWWELKMKFNDDNPIPECSVNLGETKITGKQDYDIDIKTINMDPSVTVVPRGQHRAVWFRIRAPKEGSK